MQSAPPSLVRVSYLQAVPHREEILGGLLTHGVHQDKLVRDVFDKSAWLACREGTRRPRCSSRASAATPSGMLPWPGPSRHSASRVSPGQGTSTSSPRPSATRSDGVSPSYGGASRGFGLWCSPK